MNPFDPAGIHLLAAGAGASSAILLSLLAKRFLLPAPALFLAVGLLASYLWPDVGNWVSPELIVEFGTWALVIIIFEAGFMSGWTRLRPTLNEVISLGTIGTLLTALLLALGGYYLLGLSLEIAILVAVALAPTDPAAVFSALSGQRLIGRSGRVLEGEAGANDPVSIALMIGALSWVLHPDEASVSHIVQELFAEMCIGLVMGALLGLGANFLLTKIRISRRDLLLLSLLAVAFLVYGLTAFVGGSGFLAVFISALIIGELPIANENQAHDLLSALAGISELAIFTLLGLAASLANLDAIALEIFGLFIILTLVRFAVVHSLLIKSQTSLNERHFIAWGGLKGAVPIVLAAAVGVSAIDEANRVESLVFWTVFLSVALQGATLKWLARRLELVADDANEDENDLLKLQ